MIDTKTEAVGLGAAWATHPAPPAPTATATAAPIAAQRERANPSRPRYLNIPLFLPVVHTPRSGQWSSTIQDETLRNAALGVLFLPSTASKLLAVRRVQ
jgi:hypothetical protein